MSSETNEKYVSTFAEEDIASAAKKFAGATVRLANNAEASAKAARTTAIATWLLVIATIILNVFVIFCEHEQSISNSELDELRMKIAKLELTHIQIQQKTNEK